MKQIIVMAVVMGSFVLLTGCASTKTTTVSSDTKVCVVDTVRKVTVSVVDSGALVTVGSLGTSAALALSADVRGEGAKIYAWSLAMSKLLNSKSEPPTTEEIRDLAKSVGVDVDLEASGQIVSMVVEQAKIILSDLGGDPAIVIKGFGQLATGVAKATARYAQ